ncbi:hypothetical protein D3C83_52800 [compost metagenome]
MGSLEGPTWYQRFTATIGNDASRCRMTSRPFASWYFSNAMSVFFFASSAESGAPTARIRLTRSRQNERRGVMAGGR